MYNGDATHSQGWSLWTSARRTLRRNERENDWMKERTTEWKSERLNEEPKLPAKPHWQRQTDRQTHLFHTSFSQPPSKRYPRYTSIWSRWRRRRLELCSYNMESIYESENCPANQVSTNSPANQVSTNVQENSKSLNRPLKKGAPLFVTTYYTCVFCHTVYIVPMQKAAYN